MACLNNFHISFFYWATIMRRFILFITQTHKFTLALIYYSLSKTAQNQTKMVLESLIRIGKYIILFKMIYIFLPFFIVELLLREGHFGHNTHTTQSTQAFIYDQLSKFSQNQTNITLWNWMKIKNYEGLSKSFTYSSSFFSSVTITRVTIMRFILVIKHLNQCTLSLI